MKFEKHYDGDQTAAYRVVVPAYPALRAVFTSSRLAQAWLAQTFNWFYLLLAVFYGSVCVLLSVFPKIFITVHYLLGLWFVFMVVLPKLAINLEYKR